MLFYSKDIMKSVNARLLKTMEVYISNERDGIDYFNNRLYRNGAILMMCLGLSIEELLQANIYTEDDWVSVKRGNSSEKRKLIHLKPSDFINRLNAFRSCFYDVFSVSVNWLKVVNTRGRKIKKPIRNKFYTAINDVFGIFISDDNEFILYNAYKRLC